MTAVSPLRVLVVDDCTDTATTLARLLKHFGHETSIAAGGEAALQQAPIFRPDAMFIDLAMPEIDGLSVAKRLRNTSEFAIGMIYLTKQRTEQKMASGSTVRLFRLLGLLGRLRPRHAGYGVIERQAVEGQGLLARLFGALLHSWFFHGSNPP